MHGRAQLNFQRNQRNESMQKLTVEPFQSGEWSEMKKKDKIADLRGRRGNDAHQK